MLLVLAGCSYSTTDYSVTLGGDVMLSRAGEAIFSGEIDPWGELTTTLDAGDFFLVNLESPLGESITTPGDMNLCSDPVQVNLLLEADVDLATLSNNHQDDCQPGGLQQTAGILTANGILSTGSDFSPVYIDAQRGIRIAVLAANEVTGSLEITSLVDAIRSAGENAELVMVSIHWGNEYQAGPDERQEALAQQLADAGADVIWGHHPHVLQKMEWLETSDGRKALVLYSLGNLLTDQYMLADTQQSALVRLDFTGDTLKSVEVIPIGMTDYGSKLQIIDGVESVEKISDRLQIDILSAKRPEIDIQLMQ